MLQSLVESAWTLFRLLESEPHVVRPSSPVLFFGDSEAYRSSSLRVVTVGLNPSRHEFPEDTPFSRFAGAEPALRRGLDSETCREYVEALNGYFEHDPYRSWFDAFEPILNGLGASYYRGREASTALHTDLCSPVATDPTWSGLEEDERSRMEPGGESLWHELCGYLKPHVILISVARHRLDRIRHRQVRPWDKSWEANSPTRKRPYVVETTVYEVATGQQALTVFGQAAQKPFGTIDSKTKHGLGHFVKGLADGR